MTVTNMMVGRATSSSFRVKAKVTGSSVRLAVADNVGLSSPVFFGPVVPTAQNIVTLDATGLAANSHWYYALEVDSALDKSLTGEAYTFGVAGEPWSYRFWCAGDAGLNPTVPGEGAVLAPNRLSNHASFDDVRLAAHPTLGLPRFGIMPGDLNYYNLGSGSFGITGGASLANYRRAVDDVLLQSRPHRLYRSIPLVYTPDDHDYGTNDCDRTNPGKDNAAQVWRERFPDYDPASPNTAGDKGLYRSWVAGRVFFIHTDGRYYRDPPTDPAPRTYLGAGQLAWFESQLASPPDGTELLVWISGQPSNSGGTTSWGGYPEERDQIYQMFGDHGWLSPKMRAMELAADQHQLAFDTGSDPTPDPGGGSVARGFPLFTLAAFDCSNDKPGGRYDLGISSARGQFGLVDIDDLGTRIDVTVTGMVH